MIELPAPFCRRMESLLKDEAAQFFATYNRPAERAVRVNTLKISVEDFKKISPFALEPVPWEEDAFYVSDPKPGKTVLHAAGVYYVQEPSAMCAAPLLGAHGGDRVLDLCSAPGGKGTQLAQKMRGEGIIYLNEIIFSRARTLSSNVERMGIKNAVVTCAPPEKLAEEMPAHFNKILVDAPCSGEGMFKKEQLAVGEWSEQNVAMCAARQRGILESANRLLAPGGLLVYSTCTFSREEDEDQIAAFLSAHPDYELIKEEKLFPHKVRGEGHYAALLHKKGEGDSSIKYMSPRADKKAEKLYRDFERDHLNLHFPCLHSVGDRLYSLPQGSFVCSAQTLRAGVCLGEVTNGRFTPAHSLAMCLKEGEAPFVPLDSSAAITYLRGGTFEAGGNISGWAVASYRGFPLGWCKISGGVAKNHLPKALRI